MNTIALVERPILETKEDLARHFTGVLDNPRPSTISTDDEITVSGWIIPANDHAGYKLRIEYGTGLYIELAPSTPRLDVMEKRGAKPLPGDSIFNGFYIKIPVGRYIKIFVQLDSKIIHWKNFDLIDADVDLQKHLIKLLSTGQASGGSASQWNMATPSTKASCIDIEYAQLSVIDSDAIKNSPNVAPSDKERLISFAEFIAQPEFFSFLIERRKDSKEIEIPGPFSHSKARLVGSFFDEINCLVFSCGEKLFYIGQYLHTADFVYFPDRSLCLRLRNSHYNHDHVKRVIHFITKNQERFRHSLDARRFPKLGGVIINGVSPYHFFYDCLPALYTTERQIELSEVDNFYSLNGTCYFPLEQLFDLKAGIKNTSVTSIEISALINSSEDTYYILAGASYKTLCGTALDHLDNKVVCVAKEKGTTAASKAILDATNGRFPIIWVGISAQKRTWLNQIDVLKATLTELYRHYPNMAILVDGMTASIFGENADDRYFSADREIFSSILNCLPASIPAVNLTGLSSIEKLCVGQAANFFIANYSTGSMYPSRFYRLPGVTHLSHGLFEAVKGIHIHYNAHIFPFEHVVDIPDPENNRLDFISYSIDIDKFPPFVCDIAFDQL